MNSVAYRHSAWRHALVTFVMVLVVSGALFSGYLFFSTLRALTARTVLPFVDPVPSSSSGAIQGRAPEQELPDMTKKKERVNILLLGIDQREIETGPWRTDTMILISIDPAEETAAMLSIPRDLWVAIPGYGESRINEAHFWGDARKYPGGGPALAKKTVWHALGIPVHYYVRINFTGFEKLIDAIGGVTIDVKKPIHDDAYPDNAYGTMVIDIPAGVQHMNGKVALQYARSRHGSSDFDRMARQQTVLMAIRDKALSLDIPFSRIPEILRLLGDSVQTDMTIDEILTLAKVAKRIRSANLRSGIIDDTMTTTVVTPQGWMVQVADWEKVRKLVNDLFPVPLSTIVPTLSPGPDKTQTRP